MDRFDEPDWNYVPEPDVNPIPLKVPYVDPAKVEAERVAAMNLNLDKNESVYVSKRKHTRWVVSGDMS